MLKAKKVYWLAQIGGWLLLSLLLYSSTLLQLEKEHEKIDFVGLVLSISVFFGLGISLTHAMRFVFIRLGWLNIKLGPLVPRALFSSIFFAALMTLGTNVVAYLKDPKANQFTLIEFFVGVFLMTIFFVLWNSVYFTFHFFQRSRDQELNNLQLTASNNEIELKNLRSQLNPHFLFNSLNSIRALIDLDPKQAQINVTKLSNLLRKSLVLGKEQLVTLSEELAIVQDYLDLEKVRFEERVEIIQEHDEALKELLIPPFMLQTLVENAFKHGISQLISGGTIWIKSYREGNKIYLTVENSGKLSHSDSDGIGIKNTERRLELQYGGNARFQLEEKENTVLAIIALTNT